MSTVGARKSRGRRSDSARAKGRVTLTRADVIAAGAELLDTEGVERLSMRKLADHLSTGPATLYWHVHDKSELLLLILDDTLREISVPADGSWDERLRAVLSTAHEALVPRPALIEVLWETGWVLGPEALRVADELVGLVAESGVPEDEVADTYISVVTLLFGFVTAESTTRGNRGYTELRSPSEAAAEDDEAEPPRRRHPNLVRYAPDAMPEVLSRRFHYALDLLISGVEARAAVAGSAASPR